MIAPLVAAKILLVDHLLANRAPWENVIAPLNIDLVQVNSVAAMLQSIHDNNFAVILLSSNLPEVDVLNVAQVIRTSAKSRTTPIVFLDALAIDNLTLEKINALGRVDYLTAELPVAVVRAKIALLIDLYRTSEELVQLSQVQFVKRPETELESTQEQLKSSEERYRTLFNSIDEGFALIELIFDANNVPVDYLFLETNPVFEQQTGLANAVGKTARELVPNLEAHWFEIYGKVALTGDPIRFVEGSEPMNRWFSVYATRVGDSSSRKVGLLFSDISERKRAEAERERLLSTVQVANEQMTDVFRQAPAFMCILRGPQHAFELVNERYLQLIGQRDVTGKTVSEALPEVIEQGYIDVLDKVYESGKPYVGTDARVRLKRKAEEEPEERIVDFVYLPLKDVNGQVSGILLHGIDITERKRAEEDLQHLAADLSEANRRKTEFLATLAHELRNPLAPILNGLEVMRLKSHDPVTLSKVRDLMQRQVNQMVHLINDLLDIARIDSGKVELKKEYVVLQAVVTTAIEASNPLIISNNHKLTVNLPHEEIVLELDPARLSQILGNVLTNAAKYTPNGGEIKLSIEVKTEEVIISVSDNGVGIPAESLDNIFEMFTQVGRNMSLAQGGLGIGLSLVRRLVEMHGGRVEVASPGVGQGSTFTLHLPRATNALDARVTVFNTGEPIDERKRDLRILVADDNVDAAETLASLLELDGYVIRVVHDGIDALKQAQEFKPDVAFLDIGMPGLTGLEVAAGIRKTPGLEKIILIALTGWGSASDRIKTDAAGFTHHLTKPAQFKDVKALLSNLRDDQCQD